MTKKREPNGIFAELKQRALTRVDEIPDEAHKIRGIWNVDYAIRLTGSPTILHLSYVVVQTLEQGCSYFEPSIEDPGLNERLLGSEVMTLATGFRSLDIAALDAIYAHLAGKPNKIYRLEGSNIQKASKRAKIVCDEVFSALEKLTPKNGDKFVIVNVGVVGDFLDILTRDTDIKVEASDFYRGVVGTKPYGITVNHGSKTPKLVAGADLAVITGMTLATDTLDEILNVAVENKTTLVMFAETGANFASEYCRLGIDVVISEPLPFYLTGRGRTTIKVYRRSTSVASK